MAEKQGVRCVTSAAASDEFRILNYRLLRFCAKQIYGSSGVWYGSGRGNLTCVVDSDCPTGVQCDMTARECVQFSQSQLDQDYYTCIFNGIPNLDQQYFAKSLNLAPGFSASDLATAYRHNAKGQRCLNVADLPGFSYNQDRFIPRWFYNVAGLFSFKSGGSMYIQSLQETTDLDYYGSLTGTFSFLSSAACDETIHCNTDNTCNGTLVDCQAKCNDGQNACMICDDPLHCHVIPGVSQGDCANRFQCNVPSIYGQPVTKYIINNTQDQQQCQSTMVCSERCGWQASSYTLDVRTTTDGGYCFDPSSSLTACAGTFSNITFGCYYQLNSANCTAQGHTYSTAGICSGLTATDAFACYTGHSSCSNANAHYVGCSITEKICTDQASCLNSGRCIYQDGLLDWSQMYPGREFGSCLLPKQSILSIISTCDGTRGQKVTGNLCIDYNYDRAGCQTAGGTWTTPATSSAQCLSYIGCQELLPDPQYRDTTNQLLIRGFSPKTIEDCLSPYNSPVSSPLWTTFYSWSGGEWVSPSIRPAQWTSQRALQLNVLNKTTATTYLLISDLNNAGAYRAAISTYSELQCRNDATTQILEFVTCGCFGGSGKCAGLQEIASATGRVCQKSPLSTFTTTGVLVTSNATSVMTSACSTIQLFGYSENNFKITQTASLADSLVRIKEYSAFDVTNEAGAVIGSLLSNGVTVVTDVPFTSYNVCFPLDSSIRVSEISRRFRVDFGLQTGSSTSFVLRLSRITIF